MNRVQQFEESDKQERINKMGAEIEEKLAEIVTSGKATEERLIATIAALSHVMVTIAYAACHNKDNARAIIEYACKSACDKAEKSDQ